MATAELIAERSSTRQQPTLPAHVALLTNFIPPHCREVYVALAKRVQHLTILLSTPMEANRAWKPDWGTLDVRIQRTTTLRRPRRHPGGFPDFSFVHIPWDTTRRLKELQPDVVISAEFGLRSLFSAWFRRRTDGIPLILWANLSEHSEKGRGWLRHWLRRWLVRQSDCLAVNSKSGARYLAVLGCSPERIIHLPYAAVPDVFDRCPLERSAPAAHRLLIVGRLIELKGILPFAVTLAKWGRANPQRSIELTLVGSGPLAGKIAALPMPDNVRVRLLNEMSHAELAQCYAEHGILAFPTHADEWGMVVNEALAAGLPVLGSRYSQAVEELCVEGQTGWLFRPDAPDEMFSAIDRALNTSVDRLNDMRVVCRESIAHLTPDFAADRFVRAIEIARKLGARHQ